MLHRFYYSPIIHCPSLCPYHPPQALRRDDYDPEREEAAWRFCTDHCWLASELERPCLAEFERLRARERRGNATGSVTLRVVDPASATDHALATP